MKQLDAVEVTLTQKQLDSLAKVAAIRVENKEKSDTTVAELAVSAVDHGIAYHVRYNERKNKLAVAEKETAAKIAQLEEIVAASNDPAKLKAILAKYQPAKQ